MGNTNLASEFFVLSALHRLGIDAYLTLGNKKAVDIVVIKKSKHSVNVEVKGVSGNDDWTVGTLATDDPDNTFVVLLSFDGEIENISKSPSVWILRHSEALAVRVEYSTKNGKRLNIKRSEVLSRYRERLNAWHLISGAPQVQSLS